MTCDTLDSSFATTTTLTCATGARIPTDTTTAHGAAASGRYIVYALEELASGRHYVGLTRRTLEARIASHITQARRDRRIRPHGLMAALRLMMALGQRFQDRFSVRVLARAKTTDAARELERHWIAQLECRVPHGLNDMPGGSSVGGTDNARPLSVTWPEGATRTYSSILAALAECNLQRRGRSQAPLQASTVYARLVADWSVEEALGLATRWDPRAVRDPFAIGGDVYTTLAAASVSTGLPIATLRSRLHRARQAGAEILPQIGRDRRARSPGHLTRLDLPWPDSGECLTAAQYAARTSTPKATVMHRWHRLQAALPEGAVPSPKGLQDFLAAPAGGKRKAADALTRLLSHAVTSRPKAQLGDLPVNPVQTIP